MNGGCVFQNSRTRDVHITFSHFRAFLPIDVLTVYAGEALQIPPRAPPASPFFLDVPFRKNIVGKIVFSVSVRTSSCVNHMQIPCWEICAKFQDYWEDKK